MAVALQPSRANADPNGPGLKPEPTNPVMGAGLVLLLVNLVSCALDRLSLSPSLEELEPLDPSGEGDEVPEPPTSSPEPSKSPVRERVPSLSCGEDFAEPNCGNELARSGPEERVEEVVIGYVRSSIYPRARCKIEMRGRVWLNLRVEESRFHCGVALLRSWACSLVRVGPSPLRR
jgi:hypothetical protein